MTKLISNNFKLFNAEQFIESFSEPSFDVYYFYVGRHVPYTNDNVPPNIIDNVNSTFVDPYETMIYGKRITTSDITKMTTRHDWASNTVYTKYRHDSNTLFGTNFYVVVDEGATFSVFKCLDNNNGQPSTYEPLSAETSADDDFYITPDNYQWKFMYSVPSSTFSKFATSTHMPVLVHANVVGNAVSGSIDNIELTSTGNGYASYANGIFQEVVVGGNDTVFAIDPSNASSNANFYANCALKVVSGVGSGQIKRITSYTVSGTTRRVTVDSAFSVTPTNASGYEITPLVTVVGDGTGATARAIVNSTSNTIHRVEIVTRGQDYTYATISITGNTGIINVATSNTIQANNATAKAIISPKGGHGSNAASELGAHYVGVSVTFDSTLSGGKVVDENDFRTVGIIKNALFSNVSLTISGGTGIFQDEEVITQSNTGAYGVVVSSNSTVVKLSNAYGFFQTGNSTVNFITGGTSTYTASVDGVSQPTTYIDQTTKLVATKVTATSFIEDELVVQLDANARYYSSNNTVMRVTDPKGTFSVSDISTTRFVDGSNSAARSSISAIIPGDLVRNSGDVLYIENFTPITKLIGQTESMRLVLEF
jgi:hypothetical protein